MITIFLAVSTILLMVFGYFIMTRVDLFLEAIEAQDTSCNDEHAVLVFVDVQHLAQVEHALSLYRKSIRIIQDFQTMDTSAFHMVLAVSSSDLNNILLCAQMHKAHPVPSVALCNDPQYSFVYKSYGVEYVARNRNEAIDIFKNYIEKRLKNND